MDHQMTTDTQPPAPTDGPAPPSPDDNEVAADASNDAAPATRRAPDVFGLLSAMHEQLKTMQREINILKASRTEDEAVHAAVSPRAQAQLGDEAAPPPPPRREPGVPYFDPTRPHGTIRNHPQGAFFEQDGYFFNAQKEYMPKIPRQVSKAAPAAPGPAATARSNLALGQQPSAEGSPPADKRVRTQQNGIDLQKWADGTEKHLWAKARVAIRDATGTLPDNKEHGLDLLREHGVIDHGDDMDEFDGS